MESHYRSILKAISYRFCGSLVTFAVAYVFTRQVNLMLGIGIADTVLKIGAFYFHERLWAKLHFGRLKTPDYQI